MEGAAEAAGGAAGRRYVFFPFSSFERVGSRKREQKEGGRKLTPFDRSKINIRNPNPNENAVVSDLWRELGGGTELRADALAFDADGSDFDGVGLSSSSSASSADFYYDGASVSAAAAALNAEEMNALMSDGDFIAMAERDTVDDDDEDDEGGEEEDEEDEKEEGAAGTRPSRKGSALRI